MPIANCRMPIERAGDVLKVFKSAIGNRKSEMFGWSTRPGSQNSVPNGSK